LTDSIPRRSDFTDSEGSITVWIGRLRAGEPMAAQPLWEAYFGRLVELARWKLAGRLSAAADEEDVALSAFDSFCRRAGEGRFPDIEDRDDLWKLLIALTARKALNVIRREGQQKRGGGRVLSASSLVADGEADAYAALLDWEPLTVTDGTDNEKEVAAANEFNFNGNIGLNRPGMFTLTDEVAKKSVSLETPLKVTAP
jgi:ECF sigma factor